MSRESDLAAKKKDIEDRLRAVCRDMSEEEFQRLVAKVLRNNSILPVWGRRKEG